MPNTPYNKTSEHRITDNFSFAEVAQLAEHFRKDLGLDRAMVVIGGWINGGYDGRHPDILPAAHGFGDRRLDLGGRIVEVGQMEQTLPR